MVDAFERYHGGYETAQLTPMIAGVNLVYITSRSWHSTLRINHEQIGISLVYTDGLLSAPSSPIGR